MSSVAEKLQRKSQKPTATKQVRLRLVYIDFWSAIKLSFTVSICVAITNFVVTLLVWTLLNQLGVLTNINNVIAEVIDGFNLLEILSLNAVLLFSGIMSAITALVGTVLGGIATLLYNLIVRLTGGLLVGYTNN